MKAFAGIAKAATVSKALDGKTKELIALGIAVAVRCDDCGQWVYYPRSRCPASEA